MYILQMILWATGLALLLYFLKSLKDHLRIMIHLYKLPGPKKHIIIGNLKDLVCQPEQLFSSLRKWAIQYYPIYVLAPMHIMAVNIVGPEETEIVMSSMKHISKSKIYNMLLPWLGTGLLTSTGDKWQTRRKILTPAFHFNILQQFLGIFNDETEKLVERLQEETEKTHTNVIPIISLFTLCTINETSMGTVLNLDNEEELEYKNGVHNMGKFYVHRLVRPWLHPELFYYCSINGYRERKTINVLHKFTTNIIRKRAENFKPFTFADKYVESDINYCYSKRKRMAMLDLLLNAQINDGVIDEEGIREEVDTFMFEGHDTTSMAICFSLMLLACNRREQDLIYQEIKEVFGDSDRKPNHTDLQSLKYTERCIKECLRIYPSVAFISRIAGEDIKMPNGYIIPENSIINIHLYDIHHSPHVYPDPEKFDPDRFLPENCQNRHPFAYVPFSGGPRNCIGQRFAMMELKIALCGILKQFILEPVDTPDTIVMVADIVLRPKNELRVKFVKRI